MVDSEARAAILPDVAAVLATRRRTRWRRWIAPALVVAAAGAGIVVYRSRADRAASERYQVVTTPARRGDLAAIVTATGNLEGLDTVDVGAEINGRVKAVLVDFNDRVTAGQVLCEIDPTQLTATRNQARAQVQAAEAELRSRQATAREARQVADRAVAMSARGLVSAQALEAAQAAADRAEAAVASGAAQITVARAALENAETALAKAWIRSPMDGVVLSRSVEVGQTVNATMQAPVLFTIAKDLTRMELTIAIDEADIGQVVEGQAATFTVDAFPGRSFTAHVRLIQNVGTLADNVVTYPARLTVDNASLLLRPGMTATVNVLTAERKGALLVPNAGLRYRPPAEGAPEVRMPLLGGPPGMGRPRSSARPEGSGAAGGGAAGGGAAGGGAAGGGAAGGGAAGGAGASAVRERDTPALYVERDGQAVRVPVEVGLTDGTLTEIAGGALREGELVITDVIQRKAAP